MAKVVTAAALVIDGTVFGLMRIVTAGALPGPKALLAPTTTEKSPLWVGVPEITPVDALTDRPAGRPLAL